MNHIAADNTEDRATFRQTVLFWHVRWSDYTGGAIASARKRNGFSGFIGLSVGVGISLEAFHFAKVLEESRLYDECEEGKMLGSLTRSLIVIDLNIHE